MRHSPLSSRAVSALLLACYLPACTKWGAPPQTGVTPAEVVAANPNKEIRLTLSDGRKIEVDSATVAGGGITGHVGQRAVDPTTIGVTVGDTGRSASRMTVPAADVRAVQVRRGNPVATVGLVFGAAALVGFVALAASGAGDYNLGGVRIK